MISVLRASVLGLALAAAAPAPSEVTIVNHAGIAIVELYVSAADEDSWGENRLNKPVIAPGQSFRVTPLRSRGCHVDVRAIYANGTLEDKRGLDACHVRQLPFDAVGAAAPPSNRLGTLTLLNHAPRAIIEVYVSAASADDWGDDVLANHPIPAGGSADIRTPVGCRADLRVVFDNRAAEERRDIDLCAHPKLEIKPGWTTQEQFSDISATAPRT